jgi:hypothetical protein
MSTKIIERKQEIHDALRRRLRAREVQAAIYGISADPSIGIEIEELKHKIANLEKEIHQDSDSQKVSNDLEEVIMISEAFLEYANASLVENETILAKLFYDRYSLERVSSDMNELYHIQRNRGNFAKWISSLEEYKNRRDNDRFKVNIDNLIEVITELRDIFYSSHKIEGKVGYSNILHHEASQLMKPDHLFKSKKSLIARKLREARQIDDEITNMAEEYLNRVRTVVEKTGTIVGKLKVLNSA